MPSVVKQRPPRIDTAPTPGTLAAKIVELHQNDRADNRVGEAILRLGLEGKKIEHYTPRERQALWEACGWASLEERWASRYIGTANARRPIILDGAANFGPITPPRPRPEYAEM